MERLEKSEFDQHRVRERLKQVEVQVCQCPPFFIRLLVVSICSATSFSHLSSNLA